VSSDSNNTWTDQQIENLRDLATQNLTASRIAESFPGKTRNAILGKLHRLGLHIAGVRPKANYDSYWSQGEKLRELAGYVHSACGFSHHEIAAHFGVGMSTLRRGLAKMRAQEGSIKPLKPNAASLAQRGSRPHRPRTRTLAELGISSLPLPTPQIELDIIAGAIDFMELNGHTCRFPVEGAGYGMRYCGRQPLGTKPYCGHHCRKAYAR